MNHLALTTLSHCWPLLLGGAALVPATMPLWYLTRMAVVVLIERVRS